jgi:hypothetical protein
MMKADEETMRRAWMVSDEWVDANIREWCRMRNDGMPYQEECMRRMQKRAQEAGSADLYYLFMAYASLGLDPILERDKANPNHITHRAMTMMFYAKLIHEVGEKRVRARWNAMVKRGELQP